MSLSNKLSKKPQKNELITAGILKAVSKYQHYWTDLSEDEVSLAHLITEMTEVVGGRSETTRIMDVAGTTLDNYRQGKTQPKYLEFIRLSEAAEKQGYKSQDAYHAKIKELPENLAAISDGLKRIRETKAKNKPLLELSTKAKNIIPYYEIQAHAGSGGIEPIQDIKNYITFDQTWLDRNVMASSMLGMLDVNGDSMDPTLRNGDIILVDMNETNAKSSLKEGGIFAFSLYGDFKVKRLQPLADGSLSIISDNQHYQTETISPEIRDSDLRIQGVVLKRIGNP